VSLKSFRCRVRSRSVFLRETAILFPYAAIRYFHSSRALTSLSICAFLVLRVFPRVTAPINHPSPFAHSCSFLGSTTRLMRRSGTSHSSAANT
jgi:hypothetical protein